MFLVLLSRYALMVSTLVLPLCGGNLCASMAYENRNQVDYSPLALMQLRGKAIDPSGVPIPGVCVGLFRESDHSLVAVSATDADGMFVLKSPPPGDYRVVATYSAFGTANARVRLGRGARSVVLRMRPSGIDTGSYIESK